MSVQSKAIHLSQIKKTGPQWFLLELMAYSGHKVMPQVWTLAPKPQTKNG